ncbi:MAG: DUF2203 domain-containing protein [Elusimicrobiota bacterium]
MQRFFTLQEAEALIPKLELIYGRIIGLLERAAQKSEQAKELESGSEESALDALLARSQNDFLHNQINEQLREVMKLGAIPKGFDPCLVDFPHLAGGQEVYLCWKEGEQGIDYYHGVHETYKDRKPLSGKALLKRIFGEE